MTNNQILASAKQSFNNVVEKPYPEDLVVSDWWKEHQAKTYNDIYDLETVDTVIRRSQSTKSSFDHRELGENAKQTVNFKLSEIKLKFPQFDHTKFPKLHESLLSIPESIIIIEDKPFSSIFLTHLCFYLRTMVTIRSEPKRILEIGSGYGGLARIYNIMSPDTTYVLVDLPESLFYAQVFLMSNFKEAKIFYVEDAMPYDIDDYDFVFVPVQLAYLLKDYDFDLTINTGSLQEMTAEAVFYWMNFIQNTISTNYFYSWNYFLNNKSVFKEASSSKCLISPILDEFWKIRYFRINDPILTIDCDQRNWLEVLVERIPKTMHADFDRLAAARNLVDLMNSYRVGTNYWFSYAWMSVWVNQSSNLIEAMLYGIECFGKGKAPGIPNLLDTEEFGEVEFYQKILKESKESLET